MVVNEAVPDLDESTMFQLHKHIGCDESLSQELQKAKFELKGILAGCKFEVVTDTVDKLRSIFNCNVSEAEDFRSMFVDERNQSFDNDEKTMLLVMRGWMVTNAHCRRCSKACLMLRPVDGEMMCPKCDDVDAGPAVTFPSNLGSGTPQSEPVIHDSPRHIAFGVPSQLNQWTPVDRECMHCSRQLMRNPNLETDHCPACGPVLTVQVPIPPTDHIQPTSTSTKSPALPLLDVPAVPVESQEMTVPVECDTIPPAVNESVDDDTKENDILDAEMLKELKETMRQIEEAKRFLLSKRTPRMMMSPLPPTSNKSLQQISPALMSNTNNHMMPSSVRAGILKPSGYRTPQLTNNSGHRTPQIPGKIFFA